MKRRRGKAETRDHRTDADAAPASRRLIDAPWFWPVLIFIVAFILRAVYVTQVRYTPFFQTLGLDAKFYDRWARELASGTVRGDAYFMTPLYPYFLAAIYRLFGRNLLLVRMIQAGLGSLTAVLAFLIGREVYDRRVGILSGLLAATYGALIFYDGSILLTPALVFLNLLAIFVLLRADATSRSYLYLLAGLTLGLAAVGRAAVLAFIPFALLWVWLDGARVEAAAGAGRSTGRQRKRKTASGNTGPDGRGVRALITGSTARGARGAGLVLLGVVLVVLPITIRNYVAARDFVVITSNGGLNFYIGNSEISTGGYVKPEGLDIELPQLENFYFQRRYSSLLRLPLPGFAILAPLGLVGLGLSLRRRGTRLLGIFFVVYVASVAAFFVLARYRLPAVPVLIICGSFAVTEFWNWARAGEWKRFAAPAVALVVLAVLVNTNFYGVDREKGFAQSHFRLGIIYGERGLAERAMTEYRKSIAIDPNYPKSHLNLGVHLARSGQAAEAIGSFRRALELDPGYAEARVNLAIARGREGEYDVALAQLDTLLSSEPHHAMGLKERGIALYRSGRLEEAIEAFEEAARWDRDGRETPEIEFYLGLIRRPERPVLPPAVVASMARADTLARTGHVVEAVELYEDASRQAPASGEPLRRLALLKREMSLRDEAVELLRRALRLEPTLEHGHFALGVVLNELGRHDEALHEYDAQLRITPDYPGAHLNVALTYQFHTGNPNLAAFHYGRYRELGGEPVPAIESVLRGIDRPGP